MLYCSNTVIYSYLGLGHIIRLAIININYFLGLKIILYKENMLTRFRNMLYAFSQTLKKQN